MAIEAGVDKVISKNLILHFIPINFENGEFHRPQFGVDYHRSKYYVSAITNLQDFTVQIGSSPTNRSVIKSIKFGFDGNSLVVSPVYEREVTPRLRMFIQAQIKGEKVGDNSVNAAFGIAYGYRLKLLDELKLEIASFVGTPHSNLQISILTPKFQASIPIFSRADLLTFELYKLGVFVGVYLSF